MTDTATLDRQAEIAAHDGERREAFKLIDERFHSARRRRREKLKWLLNHPSPRPATEQLRNISRALWD